MTPVDIKRKLNEIAEKLPENKLKALVDYAASLKEREEMDEFLKCQENSASYREWVSEENNIYDEVFKNEAKQG